MLASERRSMEFEHGRSIQCGTGDGAMVGKGESESHPSSLLKQ
jgi:hypothetical protein